MTKTCTKCGEKKHLSEFHKRENAKDGVRNDCMSCRRDYNRNYRKGNQSNLLMYDRKRYRDNREDRLSRQKEYYKANKDKIKKYRETNKESLMKQRRAYCKKRRVKDAEYRIISNLRSRMGRVVKGKRKADTTKKLIGCTTKKLKVHLEKQFTDGMSWDNYGRHGWHIDHIIPCASFDMLDPEQQKKCFHYTNLQPLWAKDNIKKGDKFPHEL